MKLIIAFAKTSGVILVYLAFIVMLYVFGSPFANAVPTVTIHGDSLNAMGGDTRITDYMNRGGMETTCVCKSGKALMQLDWLPEADSDVVVFALLTNDAIISRGMGDYQVSWLRTYLYRLNLLVRAYTDAGKRVIVVLPTLTTFDDPSFNYSINLFRYFAAYVTQAAGGSTIDMHKLGVPIGSDGIHYDQRGRQLYAYHLYMKILNGEVQPQAVPKPLI